MQTKIDVKRYILKGIWYVVGVALLAYFLLPFFVLLSRAFMTLEEVATIPAPLVPKGLAWGNFTYAFKRVTKTTKNITSKTCY